MKLSRIFLFNVLLCATAIGIVGSALRLGSVVAYGMLFFLICAALLSGYVLYRNDSKNKKVTTGYFFLSISNVIVAYACLASWSLFNSIVLFGGWLLISSYIFYLVSGRSHRVLRRSWFWVNGLITLSIVLAAPDINGVTLHFKNPESAVYFAIMTDSDHYFRRTEHSRSYKLSRNYRQFARLRSPLGSNEVDHFNILIQTKPGAEIVIEKISLDNYAGYHRSEMVTIRPKLLTKILSARDSKDKDILQSSKNNITITPKNRNTWLTVKIDDGMLNRDKVESDLKNKLKTIGLWELVWFLFISLAPFGGKRFRSGSLKNYSSKNFPLPWWVWTTIIHIFFIVILRAKLYANVPDWLSPRVSALALTSEGNYAVWWSGFCLAVSGLLFYMIASRPDLNFKQRIVWSVLAIMAFALSIDEVTSLHERVSQFGGWWALLPFAVTGTVAFGYAIGHLVCAKSHRLSGVIILCSLIIFFGVAGLEFLEHNVKLGYALGKIRIVTEESIELFASSLLIFAGVLEFRKYTNTSINRTEIIINPIDLLWIREILFIGLVLYLYVVIIWVPFLWESAQSRANVGGNPKYWYPMFVFLLVALYSVWQIRLHNRTERLKWWLCLAVFLLLSTGQLYNLGYFLDGFTDIFPGNVYSDYYPKILWTLVPVALLVVLTKKYDLILRYGLLFLALLYFLHHGSEFSETYYIFSGLLSYLSFLIFTKEGNTRQR